MQAYLNLFKKIKIPARVNLIGVIFELAYVMHYTRSGDTARVFSLTDGSRSNVMARF